MVENRSIIDRVVIALFYIFLAIVGFICLLPMINLLAISLSDRAAATGGRVTFWPVGFNLYNYEQVLRSVAFLQAMWISVLRVIIGTAISVFLAVLTAYPLSRSSAEFKGRNLFVAIILFAMMFSGGMIPLYMVVRNLHMLDTLWSLVLPGAVTVGNTILVMNFFRNLPKELDQAARVDGATHWQLLRYIYVPMSVPVIATITLFVAVVQWNSWFDGLIYINDPSKVPLQTYLYRIIQASSISSLEQSGQGISPEQLASLSDRSLQAAQIIVATVPILIVYPFVQKYFVRGIKLGALKE